MKKKFQALAIVCMLIMMSFMNSAMAQINTSWVNSISTQQFSPLSPFPSNEITSLAKSKSGYIWISTQHGLYRFDGYQYKAYKNTISSSSKYTCNNMRTVLEDADGDLWIGTTHGLNFLNVRNGMTRQYHFTDYSNSDYVTLLLFTTSGQLWVGTEGGLYIYNKESDEFVFYCDQMGNSKVPHSAIKSIHEDKKGYVWVGTWDRGLYRYCIKSKEWYEMPKFNDINSAHVVMSDNSGKLWVGTWGKGLYRIDNPYAKAGTHLHFKAYHTIDGNLLSDYIQSMKISDKNHLWIGTSQGLSLCTYDANDAVIQMIPSAQLPMPDYLKYGAISLLNLSGGDMLLVAKYRGLVYARTAQRTIKQNDMSGYMQNDDRIASVDYDHQGRLWMSLRQNGILMANRQTGEVKTVDGFPLADEIIKGKGTNSVFETRGGDIIICTTSNGMIVYPSGNSKAFGSGPLVMNKDNTPWMHDNCIYRIAQDKEGNLIIGSWDGIDICYTNGKGCHVETDSVLMQSHITYLTTAKDGAIWLASSNGGLFRITGDVHTPKSLKVKNYVKPLDTELPISDAVRVLQDGQGRIWACSLDMGLMLYDKAKDGFVCVNHKYSIPDDAIYSMEEAKDGSLWLSTRLKLIRLVVNKNDELQNINFYTDGAKSDDRHFNQAGASSISSNGELCFAGIDGYSTFFSNEHGKNQKPTTCAITDIRIFNRSLEQYDKDELDDITDEFPPYTKKITLDQNHNDITIEFSSFNISNPDECRFAYMLEGYDKDWIYALPGEHSAYYCNLTSGTYTFHLKAADSDGAWSEKDITLTIVVLPPLWLRWWALLIYAILIIGACIFIYRYLRNQDRQREKQRIAKMESEKVEELNHKKLQFYTNITHDLMTPLTVISATVSDLEQEVPEHKSSFTVIQNNLSRQMRLLQQILEFRKVETGNLRLRVSNGDICEFCRREVESIQPLMQKKKLHLSLVCSPEYVRGYFDTDALDKILYNLLSNAAKYNRELGYVQVTLTEKDDVVTIAVKDNGQGIPKSKQGEIFTRFYEGEHRKFNTYGTGIGLSLTRDLVQLHHGEIRFESEEGQGTTFYVTIPIARKCYKEEEIEEMINENDNLNENDNENQNNNENKNEKEGMSTILVVEDNDEILNLLKKLLNKTYNVLTAYNGKEGLEILDNETVDLIVSDIMMPVMDGVEMLRQVRNNPDIASIPVIMLTAKRDDQDRAEAYEVGADAYMTKPFNTSVLQARIENLVERSQKQKNELRKKDLVEMADINISDEDEEFLKRCIACVQKHISDTEFDQQAFADEVGTSKSTLYKRLKALTNCNTSAFIRSIRMKTACEVLKKTPNIRISELAYQVGYNDPKYFSSCFKKDFGVLPTEYGKE